MTRRQLLIILLALAIVGTAGLILVQRGKDSWAVHQAKAGDKVLPNFRYNDVAAIHIKAAAEFNIAQQDGVWRVHERNDFPANYQQIRNLLFKIRDIKVVQSERVGASQLPRVDLAGASSAGFQPAVSPISNRLGERNSLGTGTGSTAAGLKAAIEQVGNLRYDPSHQGVLIEFKDAQGKLLDSLLLGKMHLRHEEGSVPRGLHGLFDGRYILLPNDPEDVLLISDDLGVVAPEAGAWLSKDFFKFENIQSMSLISTDPGHSWSLSRDGESRPWTLTDRKADGNEVLDATAASEVAEMFRFLTFVDVVPKNIASEIVKPTILTALTFDQFAYTLKVGPAARDGNYPLTVAVSADESKANNADARKFRDKLAHEKALAGWVYIVEPQIIEVLLRDRAHLLEKKSLAGAN